MNIHCEISTHATDLCAIIEKHGSDKGGLDRPRHYYTRYYYNLFTPIRFTTINIFEFGVGTFNPTPYNMGSNYSPGSSLRAWRDFFPHANIYSADIDESILFTDDRIQTFPCDQKNWKSIQNMWKNQYLHDKMFDIIIDDGCHEIDSNVYSFENSIEKLKSNGVYIIEDIHPSQANFWKKTIQQWNVKYHGEGKWMEVENPNFPPFDYFVVFQKH